MNRRNVGPDPASDSGSRRKPTAREHWIAVIVLGVALVFVGITLPAIPSLPPVLTLVLTIGLVLGGAAVLFLGVVRLPRHKDTGESEVSTHQKS